MIDVDVLAELCAITKDRAALRAERYEQTFLSMRRWLPKTPVLNFLDIGCGTGGVAIWVARHYPEASTHLIDGAAWGEKFSWRDDGTPWADVGLALQLFKKHLPNRYVKAWPASPRRPAIPKCDLIYSNCSWGHHYPIRTYLELVKKTLRPGGTLIVDIREGSSGHGELSQFFTPITIIDVLGKKYLRTVWRGKGSSL